MPLLVEVVAALLGEHGALSGQSVADWSKCLSTLSAVSQLYLSCSSGAVEHQGDRLWTLIRFPTTLSVCQQRLRL
jgi:hypothetical protein